MHSVAISFLAAAATLSTSVRAAPTPNGKPTTVEARGAFYVCNNNGFRGDCSVDPCAISWCPDYKPYTYEPVATTTPPVVVPPVTPAPAKSFYVCWNNGFRGDCSVDPCAIAWCPDYKPYTYEPVAVAKRSSDPTVCAPGTGYFQSCDNGFRGCCKSDACGKDKWCPDYKFGSYTPIGTSTPTKPAEPPVVTPKAETPIVVVPGDNGVCPAGTGYYQVCDNGFKGCCKSDACGKGKWCPDYKFGSYTPIGAPEPTKSVQPPVVTAKVETPKPTTPVVLPGSNGVCPPETGYYQVCANGFKGCCKKDACTIGFCPA